MQDDLSIIQEHPAILGQPFYSGFEAIFPLELIHGRVDQALDHTIAAAGTDDEVIGKYC